MEKAADPSAEKPPDSEHFLSPVANFWNGTFLGITFEMLSMDIENLKQIENLSITDCGGRGDWLERFLAMLQLDYYNWLFMKV